MTTMLNISRRVTQHHTLTGLRARWEAFQLRHSRRAQAAEFQRLHDALPLPAPDRHDMESPSLEDAFMRLAADHPETVTPADGGTSARDNDREQLLLATCDAWFRNAHGPENGWSPRTAATYDQLMTGVRFCFHAGGTS